MQEDGNFLYHESCEECGSSDAKAVYSNCSTYCFSCEAHGWTEEEDFMEDFNEVQTAQTVDLTHINNLSARGFEERKITKVVSEHFGVKVKEDGNKITTHYYPYTKDGQVSAYKSRVVANKEFATIGDFKGCELFGQSAASDDRRKLVITEGEIDAMTVAQALYSHYNKFYPVVSIPNGTSSAKKALVANRSWIREFDEVIIMFDNDEAGQAVITDAVKAIGADKVKISKSKFKDPSDAYIANGSGEIRSMVFEAKPWTPPGVINGVNTWEDYVTEKDAVYIPYPTFVEGLNDKIFGRRTGSITMFTSGTGSGKTSFLREDAYHLFKTTDELIGICSLEESVAETVRGFMSIHMDKRLGLPTTVVDEVAEKIAWEETMGTGRFMLLDHQGSVSDDSLMDKINFMAASGCKFIYLDHITIAISESGGDVNASIDKLMSDLLKTCKHHDVWLGVVSHLRKAGSGSTSYEEGGSISMDDLKGSGSLKQISAQIISLQRDKTAEDMSERHTVKVNVLKDRFCGGTGHACNFKFNFNTGRCFEAVVPEDSNGFAILTSGDKK